VNLIGEHTDYNEGFVMPSAIDFYTWTALRNREDAELNITSLEVSEAISVFLNGNVRPRKDWSDYVVGVVNQFRRAGTVTKGADVLIHGEVPIGAGLSSSAALEVSVGFAALRSRGCAINRTELALLCQRAENDFAGMRCGIMDQFISCHGKANHALLLDCRSLDFQLLPIPPDIRIVICNTMVKHSLAAGEYNLRREECETGVRLLSHWLPEIRALRDVSIEQFERYAKELPPLIARRCKHVISENQRVQQAADFLNSGALHEFGRLMGESHRSLRNDYAVSCPELDIMVELAGKQPGLYGARMTGGGFGGCTVNLVEAAHVDAFVNNMCAGYKLATGIAPDIYVSTAADGACEIE
jgi:galactokinase